MPTIKEGLHIDQTPIVRLETDFLQVDIAPTVGGRLVNLVGKRSGRQFLWHNERLELQRVPPYSEYDPNFYGAIDELIPNDMPETFNGVDSPDHGELWTMPLSHHVGDGELLLTGTLPLCGLEYERRISLRSDGPLIDLDYRIGNPTEERRVFLWKHHAALKIEAGDRIVCPARTARVVDPEWSRWESTEPFEWPTIAGERADVIPPIDDTMAFLFLYDLEEGRMAWRSESNGLKVEYRFDTDVFPYAWYFASYGGFDGHYMAILEPCTTMPLFVNEAADLGQCSVLEAGESIETRVTIYAGPVEG